MCIRDRVFLTTANALTIILNNTALKNDGYFYIGLIIWFIGFAFEVIADEQKRRFRNNPDNKGQFITTGLWSISRHPNYFGEIIIWIGMAIISLPVLLGWQYATLVSPIFVTILLTKVSGINLLEASSDQKWGSLESYQEYKEKTSVLIPFIKWKKENMIKKKLWVSILAIGLVMAIEKPEYKVLEKYGKIEIRKYNSMVIAVTQVQKPYK